MAGGFSVDLVPDLPRWREYHRKISLQDPDPEGRRLKLIETVKQNSK